MLILFPQNNHFLNELTIHNASGNFRKLDKIKKSVTTEHDVENFILENYPVIFLDLDMKLTINYAYRYSLRQDIPRGMDNLVPYNFDLYDWDNDSNFEIVVRSSRLGQDGHSYTFFKFIDGIFKEIGKAGYYCSLLKDKNGRIIIAEQEDWNDVDDNNMKFSYLEINNNIMKKILSLILLN